MVCAPYLLLDFLSPGSPALSGSRILCFAHLLVRQRITKTYTHNETLEHWWCWYTHICFLCFFCAPTNYANGSELESNRSRSLHLGVIGMARGHLHDPMSLRRRSCAYWLRMGPMLTQMQRYQQILLVPPPPVSFVALRSLFWLLLPYWSRWNCDS